MTLSGAHGDPFLSRGTILRIVLLGNRLTARYAKRGFIIGAVAGGLIGTLGTKSNRLPWGAAGGWGALGAAIGAIDGFSQREESVVYGVQVDGR